MFVKIPTTVLHLPPAITPPNKLSNVLQPPPFITPSYPLAVLQNPPPIKPMSLAFVFLIPLPIIL